MGSYWIREGPEFKVTGVLIREEEQKATDTQEEDQVAMEADIGVM